MKKFVFATLAFLCFGLAFSQDNRFEKGYFINNKGIKVECLIKNEEWDYNPTQFKYKTDGNSEPNVMLVNDFEEFGVGGEFKYKKESVKIDKSSDASEDASGIKALSLVNDVLLLRVRVEGKAVLYSYQNEKYTRFFYSIDQEEIKQLSYKLYYDEQEKNYRKNETYKQELLNSLICDKISKREVENLSYTSSSLSGFFSKYNTCTGSTNVRIEVKKNIKTFDLYVKGGVIMSALKYYDGHTEFDFGNKFKFHPAVEAEINLSNKKKNVSLLFEISHQNYKSSVKNGPSTIGVEYKAIDFSFGIRKYMYLNNGSMLFFQGYMTYGMAMDSKLYNSLELTKSISPSLGIGYLYKKRYTVDLKYDFNRNLLTNYLTKSAEYNSIGINVGYKFL